jgi:hypothetical protein
MLSKMGEWGMEKRVKQGMGVREERSGGCGEVVEEGLKAGGDL